MKSTLALCLSLIGIFFLFSFEADNQSLEQKNKVCKEIFKKLKEAKGISENQLPQCTVVNTLPNEQFKLAMIKVEEGQVYIDTATFNMCMDSLGSDSINGLAFILAHELAHFTNQHNVDHEFISALGFNQKEEDSDIEVIRSRINSTESGLDSIVKSFRKIEEKYTTMRNEAEADLEAGFTCYQAGYNPRTAGVNFFDKAYNRFNLNEEGDKYVSKEERKNIVRSTSAKLDSLMVVFDLANFATLIDDPVTSSACFGYIAKSYSSKEIYNNLGVKELFFISKKLSKSLVKYALPITMDLELYDKQVDHQGDPDSIRRVKFAEYRSMSRVLDNAISYFDQAIAMDETYATAELNKAIAHYLYYLVKRNYTEFNPYWRDELLFAQASAATAKQKHTDNKKSSESGIDLMLSNIHMVMAILYDVNLDIAKEKAQAELDTAKTYAPDNILIALNQKVLNYEGIDNPPDEPFVQESSCTKKELLFDSLDISSIAKSRIWDKDIVLSSMRIKRSDFSPTVDRVRFVEEDDYKFYEFTKKRGSKKLSAISLFFTKEGYNHSTTCDISKQMSIDDLDFEYGEPIKVIPLSSGNSLWVYGDTEFSFENGMRHKDWIIFNIDKGSVVNWIVCKKEERT